MIHTLRTKSLSIAVRTMAVKTAKSFPCPWSMSSLSWKCCGGASFIFSHFLFPPFVAIWTMIKVKPCQNCFLCHRAYLCTCHLMKMHILLAALSKGTFPSSDFKMCTLSGTTSMWWMERQWKQATISGRQTNAVAKFTFPPRSWQTECQSLQLESSLEVVSFFGQNFVLQPSEHELKCLKSLLYSMPCPSSYQGLVGKSYIMERDTSSPSLSCCCPFLATN